MYKKVQHFIPDARHFYLSDAPLGTVSDQPEITLASASGRQFVKSGSSTWRQEEDMARKPGMLAFVFGMVFAMAETILSITTWAGPPNPEGESAAPPPPKETIYRPDNWTVY